MLTPIDQPVDDRNESAPPQILPIVTGRRFTLKKFSQVKFDTRPGCTAFFTKMPIGMKYMFATQCSNPQATKAVSTASGMCSGNPSKQRLTCDHERTLGGRCTGLALGVWVPVFQWDNVSKNLLRRGGRGRGKRDSAGDTIIILQMM